MHPVSPKMCYQALPIVYSNQRWLKNKKGSQQVLLSWHRYNRYLHSLFRPSHLQGGDDSYGSWISLVSMILNPMAVIGLSWIHTRTLV
jgi:hypothetical protein